VGKLIVKELLLLILLALLALLIPSMVPLAMAEDTVPSYTPVILTGTAMEPIDYLKKTPFAPDPAAYLPDRSGYLDPSLSVRVETMRAYNTTIQLTWVTILHPSQLRTELCKPYPSKAVARADVLAKRVNAVLAINGDYFMYHNQGYIARNGRVYREHFSQGYDTLVINDQGDFTIVQDITAEKINAVEGKIIHAFTFGPGLVVDGQKAEHFTLKFSSPTKKTQRIALCQMDKLSYLIVATEGPENKGSEGLTMKDFAQLCSDLGAKNAYNLDGGSSSSVVLGGKKINALSTGKIRSIGDIIYFVTGVDSGEVQP